MECLNWPGAPSPSALQQHVVLPGRAATGTSTGPNSSSGATPEPMSAEEQASAQAHALHQQQQQQRALAGAQTLQQQLQAAAATLERLATAHSLSNSSGGGAGAGGGGGDNAGGLPHLVLHPPDAAGAAGLAHQQGRQQDPAAAGGGAAGSAVRMHPGGALAEGPYAPHSARPHEAPGAGAASAPPLRRQSLPLHAAYPPGGAGPTPHLAPPQAQASLLEAPWSVVLPRGALPPEWAAAAAGLQPHALHPGAPPLGPAATSTTLAMLRQAMSHNMALAKQQQQQQAHAYRPLATQSAPVTGPHQVEPDLRPPARAAERPTVAVPPPPHPVPPMMPPQLLFGFDGLPAGPAARRPAPHQPPPGGPLVRRHSEPHAAAAAHPPQPHAPPPQLQPQQPALQRRLSGSSALPQAPRGQPSLPGLTTQPSLPSSSSSAAAPASSSGPAATAAATVPPSTLAGHMHVDAQARHAGDASAAQAPPPQQQLPGSSSSLGGGVPAEDLVALSERVVPSRAKEIISSGDVFPALTQLLRTPCESPALAPSLRCALSLLHAACSAVAGVAAVMPWGQDRAHDVQFCAEVACCAQLDTACRLAALHLVARLVSVHFCDAAWAWRPWAGGPPTGTGAPFRPVSSSTPNLPHLPASLLTRTRMCTLAARALRRPSSSPSSTT